MRITDNNADGLMIEAHGLLMLLDKEETKQLVLWVQQKSLQRSWRKKHQSSTRWSPYRDQVLSLGMKIQYVQSVPTHSDTAPLQLPGSELYESVIVHLNTLSVQCRKDGFLGKECLYTVVHSDIVAVEEKG